jgi:hypothetical protein
MDEDFGDVRYGDICESDAQITTRGIMTANSPELPASQSSTQEVASQLTRKTSCCNYEHNMMQPNCWQRQRTPKLGRQGHGR